ncbi:MAG TPA: hypothetical protein VEJ00_15395, partial [Candidatus Acidoferrales bacterium]|nr:hypothetical protein [Candidatus Acidoferrales bacterium]
ATLTQSLLALSAPALLGVLTVLSHSSSASGTLAVARIAFPVSALLCGMLGGFQFPIATKIYLGGASAQAGLGVLYVVDLLGGCAGALLLSTYFIPVFGFWRTAWLSAAVNLAATLLAARVTLGEKLSQA